MNSIDMDVDTRCTVLQYLRFISKRASGMKIIVIIIYFLFKGDLILGYFGTLPHVAGTMHSAFF